jgi:hypothetical protein
MIYKHLNDVKQLILFGKQRPLHSRELGHEVVEAFPNCIALYFHNLQTVGKLPMSWMNVQLNGHVPLLYRSKMR